MSYVEVMGPKCTPFIQHDTPDELWEEALRNFDFRKFLADLLKCHPELADVPYLWVCDMDRTYFFEMYDSNFYDVYEHVGNVYLTDDDVVDD